jgi:peptide/nickel transport system substrate-binding protein
MRRTLAAQAVAAATEGEEPLTIRVAVPEGPGYRLIFAHLRRDWRSIGVTAQAVAGNARADLRLLDATAPTAIAAWYLRHFTCSAGGICNSEADAALEAARNAPTAAERRTHLGTADRLITDAVAFMPIAAPVRWSLVSPRLTGFQPNPFGQRFPGSLVARRR